MSQGEIFEDEEPPPLPPDEPGFRTNLADPPWYEQGGGGRGAQEHYPLLKTPDIIETIYSSGAWCPARNAHLWLWVTNNFLEDGLFVMRALGFRYITNAVWVKDRFGLGKYLRGQHELLLFGTRGTLPARERVPSVIHAPRTVHSRKPPASYALIERVSPGPRLELFAREERPEWSAWGNEVTSAASAG